MTIQSLDKIGDLTRLSADVAIVGGGACGLTLARALAGRMRNIVVLESGGLAEDDAHEALNAVDIADGCWSDQEFVARDSYHRSLTTHWDGARQTYGLRCRGLGGSTQAWAGKSAAFDQIDFEARDWVPFSGWPVTKDALAPWLAQAEELLNLGPGPYDATLWDRIGHTPPEPTLSETAFRTVFWKFARSRRSVTDIMRFGADFAADPPDGVRVLTNATVTRILTDTEGRSVTGLEARSLAGGRVEVAATICILAASTIENARLLLLSRDADPRGLGNTHDTVGRYLTDHPTTTIARFDKEAAADLAARFGLYGYREGGRTHVYMHGLALDPAWQRAEHALNGALFVNEERADDDPFTAAKRILKRQSPSVLKDAMSVARSPVRIVRGATARAIERNYIPRPISRVIVDVALRLFPNTVARDFQNGRLPVKLSGLRIEATTEQPPLPENRVTLSDKRDAFGLERPFVFWTAGEAARANLLRIGQQFAAATTGLGLPRPQLSDWVVDAAPDRAVTIDLGHMMGTTRMSQRPDEGVVDTDCKVHGVEGLYAAGGSVLPTASHVNPTLMMIALALRLADHLAARQPRG